MNLGQELAKLSPHLEKLPPEHARAIRVALGVIQDDVARSSARADFLAFVKAVWPPFIEGHHHKVMADAFQRVAAGKLKRLIINMPPRMGKSQLSSWLLPAWFIGKFPDRKLIQATHTAELSVNFGRKVRNLIADKSFKDIFPGVELSADSKAAGRWETNKGGEAFYIGTGGAVTGRGADLLVIDDAIAGDQLGQEPLPADFERAYDWFSSGPRQRLQPGGAIIVVATLWGEADLCGRILKAAKTREGSDKWEVIKFPALNEQDESTWPEFWPTAEFHALRAELPPHKWAAQYQQEPISRGAAIIKKEWIQWWDSEDPPQESQLDYKIMSVDPAHTKSDRADFSAITVWGVFSTGTPEEGSGKPKQNLILLDVLNERVEFPELKAKSLEIYRYWQPDISIIEAKASGLPLAQELRAIGIPLRTYTPSRGQDKFARVNSISDIFASGLVWLPRKRWAEELADQLQAFPAGAHDDLVDATTMAMMYFRQSSFVRLPSDWEDPEDKKRLRYKAPEYY